MTVSSNSSVTDHFKKVLHHQTGLWYNVEWNYQFFNRHEV